MASPRLETTGAGLVLATVSATGRGHRVESVRGGGLAWQRVERIGSRHGMTEVWRAFTTEGDDSLRVRAAVSGGATRLVLSATSVQGSVTVGAVAEARGSGTAPRVVLERRAKLSVIIAAGSVHGVYSPQARQAQPLVARDSHLRGDTWVQRVGRTTSTRPEVGLRDRARGPWQLVAVEVLPRPAAARVRLLP